MTNPDWTRRPSGRDVASHYPKAALRNNLAGLATISCSVALSGELADCEVIAEDPPGAGFGEAAIAIRTAFRMRPQTRDGQPVAGGRVRIPIRFMIPATLRATPVAAHDDQITNAVVELDCRFKDLHLDNCISRMASDSKAAQAAVKLAEEVTLPPTPTREGRIILPLVFAGPGGTATSQDLVVAPSWKERPSRLDVYRAYPEPARGRRSAGRATVECRVTADGTLVDCGVVDESPAGQKFGDGALQLMPRFKMEPEDRFGMKVQGRKIRIPVQFLPAPPPARGTG